MKYHKDTNIIIKKLDLAGLVKIIPYHGIRILNVSEHKDAIAKQLPEWYTGLMNKYEQEMSKGIKI